MDLAFLSIWIFKLIMVKNIKDDPEYDFFGIANMFTDTDYKEITFEHGRYKTKIFALNAASTDNDLTG